MHSSRDKVTCVALLAGAVLPVATANLSSAATVNGTCAGLTGFSFKTATALAGTQSTTYVDVPNTSISFVQGGSGAGCAVVSFSAPANAVDLGGNALVVRAVLDDSVFCEPKGDTYFAGSIDLRASAMTFICPSVGPGNHSIKMQFRSLTGAQTGLDRRTTTVNYRK